MINFFKLNIEDKILENQYNLKNKKNKNYFSI